MKISDQFYDHLNEVKIRFDNGDFKRLPLGYSKDRGFVEDFNVKDTEIIFVLSDSEMGEFEHSESLYSNSLFIHFNAPIDEDILESVRLFCPIILAELVKPDLPFIIAHMAQTLDGKICTNTGHSKWIGNDENLKHAHRVRAMVDGVLVGGRTIENDLPRLNVRLVKGVNPVRLLLSNSFCDFDKLPQVSNMQTFLLRRITNQVDIEESCIDKVIYYDGTSDSERLFDLLKKLKAEGIHSILLEGGSGTVSSFYNENKIDWLQLHIAPMIFGSGKSFIQLAEINEVSQGRKLKNVFYNKIGDGIMVTGELN